MRGGTRGRGNGVNARYLRSDLNRFTVLSDHTQDGGTDSSDCEDIFSDDPNSEFTFETVGSRRNKRRRQNTGDPKDSIRVDITEEIDYDSLQTDEKLTLILTKVSLGESRFARIEQKLDSVVQGQKRLKTFENVLKSYEDRIKLLEYKSIDIEARARRNNLLFYGFGEERNENCRDKIGRLLCDKFNIQPENIVIERAHRIGKFRSNAFSPRPIIAAFRDHTLTETIMSQGSNLKNTPHSVSRDYPLEITNARKLLWDELKQIKCQNPSAKVSVGYPAKLIMNNQVCFDLFPEWDSIVRGSRIDSKHPSQQRRIVGAN